MNGALVCLVAQDNPAVKYVKMFSGVSSMTFGTKAEALRLNRSASTAKRIAEICREEATNGKAPSYYASMQAQTATGQPLIGEPLFDEFSGPNAPKRPPVIAPTYLNKKDSAGIWRVLPPRRRVPNGYAIEIAMIFNDRAVAETVVASTELGVIDKIFSSDVELFKAFVASLPVANVVEDAPAAPAAPPDLSNLTPMTRQEYNSIPAALAQRKNLTDPVFKKRLNMMLKAESDARDAQMRAQQEANADA